MDLHPYFTLRIRSAEKKAGTHTVATLEAEEVVATSAILQIKGITPQKQSTELEQKGG